jgi:hypothetical protein
MPQVPPHRPPTVPGELLDQLLALIQRLYGETDGFLSAPDDQQLWYNRGYANGMIKALRDLGQTAGLERLGGIDPDDPIAGHEPLPWGKAYRHGFEMGERETHEITEQGTRS